MAIAFIFFEAMDKVPALAVILLFFLSIGGAGLVMGRRHPLLCLPFLTIVVTIGYLGLLELNDIGPSIRAEGGFAYVGLSYFAILAGVIMPVVGAVIGARRKPNSTRPWRFISGLVGLPLLGLTAYMGYGQAKANYYEYYLWPIEKAEEHYIMPLHWKDIVAQMTIWSVLVALLITSIYLLRSAFRPEEHAPQNLE